jgi:hypothetical protein
MTTRERASPMRGVADAHNYAQEHHGTDSCGSDSCWNVDNQSCGILSRCSLVVAVRSDTQNACLPGQSAKLGRHDS